MSGPWQQYPHGQGGYPNGYEYPQQPGYPQHGGWPQHGAYPPQNPHQAGSYPQEGYPQQNGQPTQGGHPYQDYGQYQQQQYSPAEAQHSYSSPHPQGFHQHGHYQQQYPHQQPPQQPPQSTQHPTAKPSPNTCYNCGDPSHWAQDCPQPRREVPHGMMSENVSRPPKRFKPNYVPPVITKYAVPPHVQAGQQVFQAHAASPNSANGFHQQSPVYSSTPNSATSPHQQFPQWQSPQYPQQYHGQYPQAHSISPPQHQGPFAGPNYGHPQLKNMPGPNPGVYTPPYASDQKLRSRSISSCANVQHAASQRRQQSNGSTTASRQASIDQSVSMESASETEADFDDIPALDIPDLPDFDAFGDAKRPQLVEIPLPCPFEPDEVGGLKPPSGNETRVQSKYQTSTALAALYTNFRDSKDFDLVRNDPIFLIMEPSQDLSRTSSSARSRSRSRTPIPRFVTSDPDITQRSTTPVYKNEYREEISYRSSTPVFKNEYREEIIHRSSTPVFKDEYREDTKPEGSFDPFDPSSGDLDNLPGIPPPPKQLEVVNNGIPPPPPPPELNRNGSWHYQQQSTAISPTRGHLRYNGYAAGSPGYKSSQPHYNGHSRESNHRSPSEDRSNRKRKHGNEDDVDSRNERRRQHDDVTPKLKRNQPKVAEIYSRRW